MCVVIIIHVQLLGTEFYIFTGLQLASYECEAPESSSEKEAHKRLR